jgi:hypothetical protein
MEKKNERRGSKRRKLKHTDNISPLSVTAGISFLPFAIIS